MILPGLEDIKKKDERIKSEYSLLGQLYDRIYDSDELCGGILIEDEDGASIIFKYFNEIGEVRQKLADNETDTPMLSYYGNETDDIDEVLNDLKIDLKKEIDKQSQIRNER